MSPHIGPVVPQLAASDPWLRYNDLSGWSLDVGLANSMAAPANAATHFLSRVPLLKPASITTLYCGIIALASSTLTHSYLCAFKSDGTVIGQTADQSSDWGSAGSTGLKSLALVGGPFSLTPINNNDFFWISIYCGTKAGTLPTVLRGAAQSAPVVNAGCTAARTRAGQIAQADTATVTAITPASIVQNSSSYWFAWS